MTENTIASNMIPSNTFTSTKETFVLPYPHVFPLPEQWNLSETPKELLNDDTNTSNMRNMSNTEKDTTQTTRSVAKSRSSTKSTTLYDSILEELKTHSSTHQEMDSMEMIPPVKVDPQFMDDYFEEYT